jgi:hypothetical protein
MKRFFIIFSIAAVVIFIALAQLIKPLAISIAKGQLKSIFKNSEVSIAACAVRPFRGISFSGVEIKNEKAYKFVIGEAGVIYNPVLLLKNKISRAYLKDAKINITLGQKSIVEFNKYLILAPSVFSIMGLELEDVSLNLESKEASLQARISLCVDALRQEIQSLDINLVSLDCLGVHVQDGVLKVAHGSAPGDISVRLIKYDLAKIEGTKGKVSLKGNSLSVDGISAGAFNGQIAGVAEFTLEQLPQYSTSLKFTDIDIERIVRDFKLEERFLMSGKFTGDLSLKGRAAFISVIDGSFLASKEGGSLTIKDKDFLEAMAKNSGQGVDLMMATFTDFKYNTGTGKIYRDKANLGLEVLLEGEKGKFGLPVIFHDMEFLKKEGFI